MKRCLWILCLAFALCMQSPPTLAGNILGLFPHPSYSHFKVFYPIMRELAQRGHNVTVVTYIKATTEPPLANYVELLLNVTEQDTMNTAGFGDFEATRSLAVLLNEYFLLHDEGQESCKAFFRSGYVQELVKRHSSAPYDLVIAEFFNTDCYLVVPHMLQVPVVGLSSCALMPWFYDRIALPDTPSHVQSEFIGFPGELNVAQRLVNFIQAKALKWMYKYYTNHLDNRLVKEYLNIDVDVDLIAEARTRLIFVNQHYTLSGNRPQTPQLIEMGGVHLDERLVNEPLPRDIADFLDATKLNAGVIFISWGSNLRATSLPRAKLEVIVEVLQMQQPLRVIWKWESDEKPIESKKILFVKWAPQLALLCHPKVKYFWGHGGLLGTTEAVYCGKPMLLTPIYGDQFLNAAAVQKRQVGLAIQYNDIDKKRLATALKEIRQSRYTKRAAVLSTIFRDRESGIGPAKCIWWIEHVLRHADAGDLLRSPAVQLNWFVYHSLDSVALLLAAAGLVFTVLYRIYKILSLMRKRHSKGSKAKTQ